MNTDDGSKKPSLASVNQQLEALKKLRKQDRSTKSPSGDAARAAIDFASASAAGCLLGYGLDYWLGSNPWGLIGGLFLGCAAGMKLMFEAEARAARKQAREDAKNTQPNNE